MTENTKEIKINVKSDTIIGTNYAQISSITVTDTDVTMEFVYVNPRPPVTEGKVVARITMPLKSAQGLSKGIVDTIKKHEEKKGKKNG